MGSSIVHSGDLVKITSDECPDINGIWKMHDICNTKRTIYDGQKICLSAKMGYFNIYTKTLSPMLDINCVLEINSNNFFDEISTGDAIDLSANHLATKRDIISAVINRPHLIDMIKAYLCCA